MKTYRQLDFKHAHGLTSSEMKHLRDTVLTPKQWWKQGPSILWRQDAQDALEAAVAGNTPSIAPECPTIDQTQDLDTVPTKTPQSDPEPSSRKVERDSIQVTVVGIAKNPKFVYVNLHGRRVPIRVGVKAARRLSGKKINVIQTETSYEPV
jgi:hypothetical protein